jgi:hypothetical protein
MLTMTQDRTYYVIDAGQILGTVVITKNIAPDSIPYLGLRTAQAKHDNPGATANTGPHNSTGSPLTRLVQTQHMAHDVGVAAPLSTTSFPSAQCCGFISSGF